MTNSTSNNVDINGWNMMELDLSYTNTAQDRPFYANKIHP